MKILYFLDFLDFFYFFCGLDWPTLMGRTTHHLGLVCQLGWANWLTIPFSPFFGMVRMTHPFLSRLPSPGGSGGRAGQCLARPPHPLFTCKWIVGGGNSLPRCAQWTVSRDGRRWEAHLLLSLGRGGEGGFSCGGSVRNSGLWWSGGELEVVVGSCKESCCASLELVSTARGFSVASDVEEESLMSRE